MQLTAGWSKELVMQNWHN